MGRKASSLLLGAGFVCLLALAGMAAAAMAESVETSGTGALFSIGMGARPIAMGGAFVGIGDDENTLFYNPAGLAFIKPGGLTGTYSPQYNLAKYGGLALSDTGFGLGGLYLESTGITGVGEDSEIIGTFDYYSAAGVLGLARRLGPIGAGAVYENVVSLPMRYSSGAEESWEKRLVAGASLDIGPILLIVDVEEPLSDHKYVRAGGEIRIGGLALRAGLQAPLQASTVDAIDSATLLQTADLSAGAGVYLGGLRLDYAFLMPKDLPETHRISLTIQ